MEPQVHRRPYHPKIRAGKEAQRTGGGQDRLLQVHRLLNRSERRRATNQIEQKKVTRNGTLKSNAQPWKIETTA